MSDPIRLTLQTDATDATRALDLLRRVRAFAEEMRAAGMDVAIDGSLSIVVRAPVRNPNVDPEPSLAPDLGQDG